MDTESAQVLRSHAFIHKGTEYFVVAVYHPDRPGIFEVKVTSDNRPVIVTYTDGFRATLGYSVTSEVRQNLDVDKGLEALMLLMETAEQDIRRLI